MLRPVQKKNSNEVSIVIISFFEFKNGALVIGLILCLHSESFLLGLLTTKTFCCILFSRKDMKDRMAYSVLSFPFQI